ncbi:MAG: Amino acid/amide ABC transporter ATP-binding protein 2, HAAT family [uncultured bacterium (gcode 4)]|uniref:Amino acid/amide ABC transporter ATP-binding protein 2, HAAT family n=1 Tax=uncultured bacterium (gcode 4) TaxID=1234023 RepID=K2F9Y3_9BACT|nr:MAG: Amino acid/amide ABC transporter ATP-binding protein 2, HAAT family [uncultured bacterium (gcode 4)]
MKTILELKDITVEYGWVKALDNASIELKEGEVVALMWPNGAGKSTILKSIFWLTPITSWKVFLDSSELEPISHEIIGRWVVFVPQGKRVFDNLSIRENLELWAYSLKNKKDLKNKIDELYESFPILKERSKYLAQTLSGWQQQMLALARWLMAEPRILLLDEPSLWLSPKMVKEVFEVIKHINEKFNTSILVVEHNIKSLLNIVDRVYVLDKWKVVLNDSPGKIISWDELNKIFLGKE